ncbi:MAG: response regulator [Bacteroidetes bacterium]|nr:response regulator [Bacteroidota bacterium]
MLFPQIALAQPAMRFRHLSTDDGMASNVVNQSLMDHRGYMWFATERGLHRYDGYRFQIYRHKANDPRSIGSDDITALLIDSKNRFWVGTKAAGLDLFDVRTGSFRHFRRDTAKRRSLSSDSIKTIYEDSKGRIWVGTWTGGLNLLDPRTGACQRYDTPLQETEKYEQIQRSVTKILEDSQGKFWIGTWNGLSLFDPETGGFDLQLARTGVRAPKDSRDSIISKYIYDIYESNDGLIWIATYEGITTYNRKRGDFESFAVDYSFIGLPTVNSIRTILEAEDGSIWCGSQEGGGFLRFDKNTRTFTRFVHEGSNPFSLADNRVKEIYRDHLGGYWFATLGGGVDYYNPEAMSFKLYSPSIGVNKEKTIRAMALDSRGTFWVSYHMGFGSFDLATKQYSWHPYSDRLSTWRGPALISTIFEDSRHRLWLGSEDRQPGFMDLYTGQRESFDLKTTHAWASDIAEDPGHRIWMLTVLNVRLIRFEENNSSFSAYIERGGSDEHGKFFHDTAGRLWMHGWGGFFEELESRNGFSYRFGDTTRNLLRSVVLKDSKKRIWQLNSDGLFRVFLDKKQTDLEVPAARLKRANAFGDLVEGPTGLLWMTSDIGLFSYDPENREVRSYTPTEGLPVRDLSTAKMISLPQGRMMIASNSGLIEYFPKKRGKSPPVPAVISSFSAAGRKVALDSSLSRNEIPVLAYDENTISLQYAMLDYRTPWNTFYEYRLEDYDDNWIEAGERSSVDYSHLPPGDYTFQLRARNGNEGTHAETSLRFTILPPFYRTWWAYLLYVLIPLALGFVAWRTREDRLRVAHQLELGNVRTAQLEELDAMKSTFFSNISHEFRTPLALIQAPVDQMLEQTHEPFLRKKLHMVQRSSSRLLHLVNQLMDLSKIDAQKFHLHVSPGELVGFVRGVVMVFESVAERKNIQLAFNADSDPCEMHFDREVVEKVLGNLLSNALKHTPSGGSVCIDMRMGGRDAQRSPETIAIVVSDSGSGIPADQLAHVFDRFYRGKDAHDLTQTGTGIGLALVKELVALHHGEIRVESTIGVGSTFEILLPMDASQYGEDERGSASTGTSIQATQYLDEDENEEESGTAKRQVDRSKPILLVVEDNADIRNVLVEYLRSHYNILEAVDGMDGWEQALERIPDLIISDVMMPKMDGNALCLKLKQHDVTNHIPVILLTARGSGGSRLEGLEARADAYLVKPVDIRELQLRIRNLIELRKTMHEKVDREGGFLRLAKKEVTSAEDLFLQKVVKAIEEHLEDESFCVEQLSSIVGMSRTQLHRKLDAIAGRSASNFIRSIRLQRGREMLEARAGNVAEIAYSVGFKSQSHFSRSFKEEFGCSPSEVIGKKSPAG